MGLIYVFLTILLTTYGQLIIKWQISLIGKMPMSFNDKVVFLLYFIINPWVISGLFAAFLAFLCWVLALTKLELSYAYPFVGLTFVIILFASAIFFNESLSWQKLVGVLFILIGIFMSSKV